MDNDDNNTYFNNIVNSYIYMKTLNNKIIKHQAKISVFAQSTILSINKKSTTPTSILIFSAGSTYTHFGGGVVLTKCEFYEIHMILKNS